MLRWRRSSASPREHFYPRFEGEALVENSEFVAGQQLGETLWCEVNAVGGWKERVPGEDVCGHSVM